MKTNILIFIIISLIFTFAGCKTIANSYTSFSIEEFDEFFNITEISEKESYIKSGNMDFAKIDDLIICPFIKETTHEECSLFLYVYTTSNNRSNVTINSVSICSKNNIEILKELSEKDINEFSPATDGMLLSVTVISDFDKNKTWFYSGNELQLSLQISVDNQTTIIEDTVNYTINLIGHKKHLMPT